MTMFWKLCVGVIAAAAAVARVEEDVDEETGGGSCWAEAATEAPIRAFLVLVVERE